MSTMSSSVTATGSFTLTDDEGTVIFNFSPSFTSTPQTAGQVIYTGEHLAQTGASQLALGDINVDRVYTFIKNVDTDYAVAIIPDSGQNVGIADLKPGECFFSPVDLNADSSGTGLQATAATADQNIQYLLCDALDN